MRGRTALDLPVPTDGLVANQPPHKVPPTGMLPGSLNVYVDLDGLLKTRSGYGLIAPLAVVERPMGMISYLDYDGNYQIIVGSLTRWQLYSGGGPSFSDISDPLNLNTGDSKHPNKFAVLPNSGNMWVYGCNGIDPIRQWHVGLANYGTNNGTNAPSTCVDMAVLNNRLVVINTTEGGTNYFHRVRWTAVNDGQTWPATGLADLVDQTQANIAIRNTSRTSAIIYRASSAWMMNAIGGGSDGFAFSFERLPAADNLNGPASSQAIVEAEGLQYYFGLDGRIYMFDGMTIYPISDKIDAAVQAIYDEGNQATVCGTYLPSKRQVWFFFPGVGDSGDPKQAICYNIPRQTFEPLMTFADAITCASDVIETTAPTWNNWVPNGTTWPQVPYASWASIPSGNDLGAWNGLSSGNMCRFFTATTDNAVVIPYAVISPMIRKDAKYSMSVTHFELFMRQATQPETLVAVLQGLYQPLFPTPVNLINIAMDLSNASTFNIRLTPGNLNTAPGSAAAANLQTNLLQYILASSGSNAGFVFAGGTIFVELLERGDYLTGRGAAPDPPQPGPD